MPLVHNILPNRITQLAKLLETPRHQEMTEESYHKWYLSYQGQKKNCLEALFSQIKNNTQRQLLIGQSNCLFYFRYLPTFLPLKIDGFGPPLHYITFAGSSHQRAEQHCLFHVSNFLAVVKSCCSDNLQLCPYYLGFIKTMSSQFVL